MSLAGDFVLEDEYGHRGIEKALQINKAVIDSNDYRRKFDNATDNPKLNKTLYDVAKAILYDRSGTRYESMYWIDGDTGRVITSFTLMGRSWNLTGKIYELRVKYGWKVLHKLKGYNNIIVIHNHPNSTAPSPGDFNSAYRHKYKIGFVVTHDGRLFKYTSGDFINEALFDLNWQEYYVIGYDEIEAQIKTITKFAKDFNITFEEVFRK
jgi:hypothetical protein